jgi:hypothetical protein
VKIQHFKNGISLNFNEVEVIDDLADGPLNIARPHQGIVPIAKSSSSHDPNFPASNAIDGDGYSIFADHKSGDDHWWEVDLGTSRWISKIILVNRKDCCDERINPSLISVMDTNHNVLWQSSIETTLQEYSFERLTTSVPGVKFVRVENANRGTQLHFIDIDVFEHSVNVARPNLYKGIMITPIAKSDSVFNSDFPASNAIDGKPETMFINNATESKNWWEVDLQSERNITGIRLHNRTDCCGERIAPSRVILQDKDHKVLWVGLILSTAPTYMFDTGLASNLGL